MTTDTITTTDSHTDQELAKAYEEYVDKAVEEGLKQYKEGKVVSHEEVMRKINEKYFSKNE
ncbi:MAG: hypothetical protein HRU03_03715 [Nanoarchaeales archaeon]|nr:hypothetical protein [Nanoarchaeales archaeon]